MPFRSLRERLRLSLLQLLPPLQFLFL